jgi:hypothetical protein
LVLFGSDIKILRLMKVEMDSHDDASSSKDIFTSGILSAVDIRKITLFFTGQI